MIEYNGSSIELFLSKASHSCESIRYESINERFDFLNTPEELNSIAVLHYDNMNVKTFYDSCLSLKCLTGHNLMILGNMEMTFLQKANIVDIIIKEQNREVACAYILFIRGKFCDVLREFFDIKNDFEAGEEFFGDDDWGDDGWGVEEL